MQNADLGGRHFAGNNCTAAGASSVAKAKVIRFPRRCRPPKTISEIIAEYSALRCPRGPYFTPLPEDLLPEYQ